MANNDGESDWKLYRYDPSMVAAIVFTVLFALTTFCHTYQLSRTRTWYFIPFVLGGYFEIVGYVGRTMQAQQSPNWTIGTYILQALLILLAPALFAASIYMELGRIILLANGEAHSIIKKRWLTKMFVAGDVLSFLAQGAGGGIMAGKSTSSIKTGENIIIAGLVIQILFFSFFVVVSVLFHVRILRAPTQEIVDNSIWQKHIYVLYAGSLLIWIRCIFRLIEYGQGNDGYLISHEVFLYMFDAVLMLTTMVLFAVVHPSEVNALLRVGGAKAVKRVVFVHELQ